jgi:hypothetical protein
MKCIVKDCANHMHEGRFVGELCTPCHTFITTGEGTYSQAYRNSQREWVGLTDEEIREAFHPLHDTGLQFARAIESKLKEKNE